MKSIETIITTNFTVLVQELERLVKEGYSVVMEGDQRPYHMIAGNFIVHMEKAVVQSIPVATSVEIKKPEAQQTNRRKGVK